MPHKHKRKRGEESSFDLPPSQKALPLSAFPRSRDDNQERKIKRKKRKGSTDNGDIPRGFRRVMAAAKGKRVKSGLDNGDDKAAAASRAPKDEAQAPRILPGEDFRSFSARVNSALPVSGLTHKSSTKNGKDSLGLEVGRTRKERKMHKLYDQWRAEERKIQEQKEEELEAAAQRELDDDNDGAFGSVSASMVDEELRQATSKKARRRAKKDDDPWLDIARRRAEAPIRLHDVAQAPPELHKKLSQPLKVRGAAVNAEHIPKSAGSLRRREELQAVRQDVVDAYRLIREHEQSKLQKKK